MSACNTRPTAPTGKPKPACIAACPMVNHCPLTAYVYPCNFMPIYIRQREKEKLSAR